MAANATAQEINAKEFSKAAAILSREQIRTFHLSGLGLDDATPIDALRPSVLDQLPGPADLEALYPMCVHPNGRTQPFRKLINELPHAAGITSAFRTAMNGKASILLEDAAPQAIESLQEASRPDIARLTKLLPDGAFLAGFDADSLVLLHASALAEVRRQQRVRFWEDVKHTAARLRETLVLDDAHTPDALTADSVSASLGSRVREFFKPSFLAEALNRPANPLRRMDAERRSRCEATLSILEEGLHDAANHPGFWLFHSGAFNTPAASTEVLLFGGAVHWAADSFAASLEFCDAALDRLTQVLRALRVARLEIDSSFDPLVHEEMLARFDWQAVSAGELFALPPIVVVETAEQLAGTSLTSFGRVLRSGRPVQIVIARAGIEPQDLREFTPDFGYLSIAHREAFVLQSSMAEPSHLLPGFAAMAKALRPAVAVVSVPEGQSEASAAWLEHSLIVRSRTFPLFTYDPDSGARWADRFRLFTPPSAAVELTPAHAAAVSPVLRSQFRILNAAAWTGDQMELLQYLDAYARRAPLAIPYIWVDGPDGNQQRALLTRDLVNFCVDRRRAWALFEELAGIAQPKPAPEGNARQEGAREAIEKVLALLVR